MEEMNELTAEERARILQHELEAVYGSSSYKIGRAVTCPAMRKRRWRTLPTTARPSAPNICIPTRNITRSPTRNTPTGPACKKRTTPRR